MKLQANKKSRRSKIQIHVRIILTFSPSFMRHCLSLWDRQWKTVLIPVNKSKHGFKSGDYFCAYSLKYELNVYRLRLVNQEPLFHFKKHKSQAEKWPKSWFFTSTTTVSLHLGTGWRCQDTWKQLFSVMWENVYFKRMNKNELSLFLKIVDLLHAVPTNSLVTPNISWHKGLWPAYWDK